VNPSSPARPLLPALLVALLVGCGAPEAKPAVKLDACKLFTEDDARASAGESVSWMSSTLDDAVGRDPLQCSYNSGSTDHPQILSLQVRPAASAEQALDRLEGSRSFLTTLSGGKVQDVPGLGDRALWVGGSVGQLHVIRGNLQLIITSQLGGKKDPLAVARQVAVKVLSRLK
jgi:hypothetical protein